MQFASDNSKLVATLLVALLLSAVLVIACPLGVHASMLQSMSPKCLLMTHSSVLGSAIETGSARTLVTQLLVAAVVVAAAVGSAHSPARRLSAIAAPLTPADPLNGRLRI
ncbi:MAG: hypothetical protein WC971_04045 [Coriobacteriia bacterium]